ncbi:MAG: DUF2892 domain-containing protein [Bacteroidetes bacterium]|nr:DUF2892 domain-containing protein [Bacteroidota bacterium]
MKKNMGSSDRVIRILIAVVIAGLYFSKLISGTAAIILFLVAGIFLLTSLLGSCPLYSVLGISTCKKE